MKALKHFLIGVLVVLAILGTLAMVAGGALLLTLGSMKVAGNLGLLGEPVIYGWDTKSYENEDDIGGIVYAGWVLLLLGGVAGLLAGWLNESD